MESNRTLFKSLIWIGWHFVIKRIQTNKHQSLSVVTSIYLKKKNSINKNMWVSFFRVALGYIVVDDIDQP